jgi:hypothetical protein
MKVYCVDCIYYYDLDIRKKCQFSFSEKKKNCNDWLYDPFSELEICEKINKNGNCENYKEGKERNKRKYKYCYHCIHRIKSPRAAGSKCEVTKIKEKKIDYVEKKEINIYYNQEYYELNENGDCKYFRTYTKYKEYYPDQNGELSIMDDKTGQLSNCEEYGKLSIFKKIKKIIKG